MALGPLWSQDPAQEALGQVPMPTQMPPTLPAAPVIAGSDPSSQRAAAEMYQAAQAQPSLEAAQAEMMQAAAQQLGGQGQIPLEPIAQPSGLVPRSDEEITRLVESGMLSPETGASLLKSTQELSQARTRATQRYTAATSRNVKAQQQYAQEVQAASDERLGRETELLGKMQAAEAETQSTAQDLQQRHQATQDEVGQRIIELEDELENQQIDPSRTMRGWKGVGQAIAMGLGAMGSALAGGPNTAMAVVQRNIERDIAAQKVAIQSKRGRLAGLQNEYQRNRQNFGDEQAAIAATRAAAYRAVETQAKIFEAQTKNEDQKMRAQEMAVQARQQADANIMQASQLELDYQLKLNQFDFNQRLALGQKNKGWQQMVRQKQRLAKAGVRGEPLYKEATKEAMQLKDEAEKMSDVMDQLEKLVFAKGAAGWEPLPTKEAAVAKGLAADLKMRIGKKMGLGALSGPDLELVDSIIAADPTRMRQAVSKAQLDALRQSVNAGVNIELKNRGFELIPGTTGIATQSYEEPVGMQAGVGARVGG